MFKKLPFMILDEDKKKKIKKKKKESHVIDKKKHQYHWSNTELLLKLTHFKNRLPEI